VQSRGDVQCSVHPVSLARFQIVAGLATTLVSLSLGIARAQPPAEDEAAPPAEVIPPVVVSLPDVELPSGVELPPGGVVELVVAVRADGTAQVDACDATEAVCRVVEEAVAAGRFEPARRGGEPLAARVSLRFRVTASPAPGTDETAPPVAVATTPEARPEPAPEPLEYGAVARVSQLPSGTLRLELEETRDMPGAFGDPFRAIEALPGVTPILSGLPYFYVRGAPPSGTTYVYDDITLPALFHLGLGPAVVHPRMIGPLRLYSGVPPARFGRFIGGVIEAEGPPPPDDDEIHGEAELRLLDVNGFVDAPLGDGRVAVAGRYGYPALLLSIFSPEVDLAYWDYQLRLDQPVGRHDHVEVVALGSYDSLTTVNTVDGGPRAGETEESSLLIQFQRLEARLVRRRGPFELGSALRFGWESSGLDEEVSIRALTLGPRIWLRLDGEDLSFRVGAELFGAAGNIDIEDDGGGGDSPQDPSRNAVFASVAARSVAAAFAEVRYDPSDRLTLDLGLRGDAWITGSAVEAALDPRLRATAHLTEELDVHVAGGVARQPAVFFIPLPGLTEVAIDRGLQTAAQAETGATWEPVEELALEAQLFVHRYWGLLFPDLFFEDDVCVELGAGCMEIDPDPRVDGLSYGTELFIRRAPTARLSGFVSYTLARAELDALPNVDYTPSYDVRHVLNAAGRWKIGGGFEVGLRLHLRSGKPLGVFYLDLGDGPRLRRYEQRLPAFFRADASVAYAWETSWGRMRVTLEWLNLTFSREPADLACPPTSIGRPAGECPVEYIPAIVVPNLGVRGSF
jgi:hypothetical protein